MKDGAKVAPAVGDDAEGGAREARLRDLIGDPVAFEARLDAARAKRLEALARKRAEGPAEQQDTSDPSDVSGSPSQGVSPLRPIKAKATRDPFTGSEDEAAPSPGSHGAQEQPETGTAVRAEGPRTVQPSVPGSDRRPLVGAARPAEVGAHLPAVAPALPATDRPRRSRRWPLAAGALAFGVALGVGLAAIAPQFDGWRIVIVRAPETEGALEQDTPSARADAVDGDARTGAEPAAPSGDDPTKLPSEVASVAAEPDAEGEDIALADLSPDRPAQSDPTASDEGASRPSEETDRGGAIPAAPPTSDGPTAADTAGATPETSSAPTATAEVAPESSMDDPAPGDGEAPPGAELAALGDLPTGSSLEEASESPSDVEPPAAAAETEDEASASPTDTAAEDQPLASADARVVLHHPPDASGPAQAMAERLASAGLADLSVSQVDLSISTPNVRFFHEADRAVAGRVAAVLSEALGGGDVAARSFTAYRPRPGEGLIEVWLSGEAPTAPAPTARAPDRSAASPPDQPSAEVRREADRQRLVRSIEEQLRRQLR